MTYATKFYSCYTTYRMVVTNWYLNMTIFTNGALQLRFVEPPLLPTHIFYEKGCQCWMHIIARILNENIERKNFAFAFWLQLLFCGFPTSEIMTIPHQTIIVIHHASLIMSCCNHCEWLVCKQTTNSLPYSTSAEHMAPPPSNQTVHHFCHRSRRVGWGPSYIGQLECHHNSSR